MSMAPDRIGDTMVAGVIRTGTAEPRAPLVSSRMTTRTTPPTGRPITNQRGSPPAGVPAAAVRLIRNPERSAFLASMPLNRNTFRKRPRVVVRDRRTLSFWGESPAVPARSLEVPAMPRAAFVLLLLTAATSAVAQAPPPQRPLTVDDLFALKQVGNPQVSPDGRWVAYVVRTLNLKSDRNEASLWMAPLDSGTTGGAVLLTAQGYSPSEARWSPDGRYLSFLATRPRGPGAAPDSTGEPKTQVWALDHRGGEARPLTRVAQGVEAYAWSPDGTRLVLAIRDTLATPWAGKSARPKVITRLQFKRDGTGYLDTLRTHLYVFTVASGVPAQITSGASDESDPAWSPDGRSIAFVSDRSPDPDATHNTDIWVVAADTTGGPRAPRRLTTNPGSDESPAWSPDGKSIAYITDVEPDIIYYATQQLALVPVAGGAPRLLTRTLDRNVGDPQFARDGSAIWFLLEDHGEQDIARIAPDGSGLTRPVTGPLDVSAFRLAPSGLPVALISKAD